MSVMSLLTKQSHVKNVRKVHHQLFSLSCHYLLAASGTTSIAYNVLWFLILTCFLIPCVAVALVVPLFSHGPLCS